jgi:tripartite-type tricarboxylate transporter receptor subunit TctC
MIIGEELDDNLDIDDTDTNVVLSSENPQEEQKPGGKKRGRKPKGGKIIQQVVPLNNNKETKPNIILHLKCSLKDLQTNTFMIHIPYRGVAPANVDLMSGQTQALFPSLAGALPHIRTGRMRPLAVTGKNRHELLKDVPTFEEVGLSGFDGEQWYGIMGPAGLPEPLIRQINEALNKILTQQDFKEKLSAEAVALRPMTPSNFQSFIKTDIERWTKVAKDRKIELDS